MKSEYRIKVEHVELNNYACNKELYYVQTKARTMFIVPYWLTLNTYYHKEDAEKELKRLENAE